MIQTIENRLSLIKPTFVTVFLDSDRDLVEYYMDAFIKKFRHSDTEVIRVESLDLHSHVSSMGFFQQNKILRVMQLHEKDYEALSFNHDCLRVLIYASSSANLKKIQKAVPDCVVIDNTHIKPWHRKELLAKELIGFAKNNGVQISESGAHYFVSRLDQNFSLLCQELIKASLFCSGASITRQAIDALTNRKKEDNFFQLAKQILFSQKVDTNALRDTSEVFSLFTALRYQIYIALNLLNGTSDSATDRVKGPQREAFLHFIQGKKTNDILSLLSNCFNTLQKVREHKIKPKDVLTHFILHVELIRPVFSNVIK